MEVKLLSYTNRPEEICSIAGKMLVYERLPKDLNEVPNAAEIVRKMNKFNFKPHIEHASFTFLIKGISRSCSHQLIRHRIASYSQQSQGYVIQSNNYTIPPSIKKNSEAERIFKETISIIFDCYNKLLKRVPVEDARFILPNAAKTNIMLTMNARSLQHFFNTRCCLSAQWEIRELAEKMKELVKEAAPALFESSGPYCASGECPFPIKECAEMKLMKEYRKSILQANV